MRAADRPASERFDRTVLGALGLEPTIERPQFIAWDELVILGGNSIESVFREPR